MKKLVAKAYKDDVTGFEEDLLPELQSRVFERIEGMRKEVAASMFKGMAKEQGDTQ